MMMINQVNSNADINVFAIINYHNILLLSPPNRVWTGGLFDQQCVGQGSSVQN